MLCVGVPLCVTERERVWEGGRERSRGRREEWGGWERKRET